ncbi:unnamed protein product [Rotaria sordida]|uniref:Uncharacterized protein n=1 Tax=Rotaria sordida TaxID=392033 RepID=A0A814AD97_9BILA|nr:unnamed protein product [Rotaria sordida]CAF1033167.1 unnamed protein product [Rotaria sordida]CAF1169262.1 unnamed protein product [Rotaria sordida]CAF3562355.1 unnamed protein product [Rotaria sordida]CAF3747624.1 unnamed protein product [Rotaria sordida]
MKIITCLLLFILLIICIESKVAIRTYVVVQNGKANRNKLYGFTILDSKEETALYRLKVSSRDIDTAILVDNPGKNIVANLEDAWKNRKANVTFSIYDYKLNKWTDGSIQKKLRFLSTDYTVKYNDEQFIAKRKSLPKRIEVYHKNQNELLAEWRRRTKPLLSKRAKYDVKIYSNKVPDAIYFFLLLMMHQ